MLKISRHLGHAGSSVCADGQPSHTINNELHVCRGPLHLRRVSSISCLIMRMPGHRSKTSRGARIVASCAFIVVSTSMVEMWRDGTLIVRAWMRALTLAAVEGDHLCTRPGLFWIADDNTARHTSSVAPTDIRCSQVTRISLDCPIPSSAKETLQSW